MGFRIFTTVGELLWYYCSPVCAPTWRIWDLILSWLSPSYLLVVASLFLDMGYLFFFLVDSSVLLSTIIQQLVVILVLSQEKMSTCPSTLSSWTGSLFPITLTRTFQELFSFCFLPTSNLFSIWRPYFIFPSKFLSNWYLAMFKVFSIMLWLIYIMKCYIPQCLVNIYHSILIQN